MFGPGKHSERDVIVGYLEVQLTSIRAASFGLTEQQARETPCRSALSVGGLIKHATYVMRQHLRRSTEDVELDEAGFALFMGSFALGPAESIEGALGEFDAARAEYLADVRASDPGAGMTAPSAPWDGIDEAVDSVRRFELVHHIEEFARHTGHADIIREQLDGADSASLVMAVEGRPGNHFVQPWAPAAP